MDSIKYELKDNNGTFVRATLGSAGFDVATTKDTVLFPGKSEKLPTGLYLNFPPTLCAQVWPRSSLGVQLVGRLCGIIDSDYRNEIKIVLINHSTECIHLSKGERIAQIVFVKICTNVENGMVLQNVRQGGFGSTN